MKEEHLAFAGSELVGLVAAAAAAFTESRVNVSKLRHGLPVPDWGY